MTPTVMSEPETGEEGKVSVSIPNVARDHRHGLESRDVAEAGTILLVEDDAFVRDVACEVLRSAGYRVLSAENASEAEGIYEEEGSEVDLLLTDVILPGETGRELAERLRRRNPMLKVLLASGYGQQIAGLAQWSEQYLAKPFSSEELLDKVWQRMGRPTRRSEMESSAPARARSVQDLAWNLT